CGRRLPRHSWDRRQDRRHAFEPLWSDRKVSVEHSRQTARSRVAVQKTRDLAHRCAAIQKGRHAALAGSDAGIREMGEADESASVTRALRKGCGPTLTTNGANGMSDVEGKVTRVGASECGQRTSFNERE